MLYRYDVSVLQVWRVDDLKSDTLETLPEFRETMIAHLCPIIDSNSLHSQAHAKYRNLRLLDYLHEVGNILETIFSSELRWRKRARPLLRGQRVQDQVIE